MMRRHFLHMVTGAAALLSAYGLSPAFAQRSDMPQVSDMRPDMPGVEAGPAAVDPDARRHQVIGSFSGWDRTHGHPRLLLYWDRQLDDETSTRTRDHSFGTVVNTAAPGVAVTTYDHVQQQERLTGGRDGGIGGGDSDALETAFVSAFLNSGANLGDRSALMREVSTRADRGDRSDQQYVESLALGHGITYLVQIAPTYSTDGSGYRFAVKILHLPTSRVLAQFVTHAEPEAAAESFVARPGGFRRERANRNTPELIGRTLAAEVMQRLE